MLPRLCLFLSILLAGDSTLPNGIRVYETSESGDSGNSFEWTAGYRTGVRNETVGTRALADVVAAFLKSTPSVRAMAVAAYGAGGEIEFFSDTDRTGIRLKMPVWAKPMVEDAVSDFLSETPLKSPELVDRALNEVRSRMPAVSDVRTSVEEQFRMAVLGPGAKFDLTGVTRKTVDDFFAMHYGTDRAFVVMNSAPMKSLQSVEGRTSLAGPNEPGIESVNAAGRAPLPSLRIQSDLEEGAVILGVPVSSVYYRNWYAFLMLDRLIHEVVQANPATTLRPSLDSYFYRMEVAVPSGQTAGAAETALLQELAQLQYVRASSEQIDAARRSAIQYLESAPVQEWFLSLGVAERRGEGLDWVRSFSADDMRATARDLVEAKPVIASWSPRVRALGLSVEKLSDIEARAAKPPAPAPPKPGLGPVRLTPFPVHSDAALSEHAPVRLDSGVSIVASSAFAVFVAPDSLKTFDREPGPDLMQTSYGAFRSSRILVMAPPDSLDRAKQQWAQFQGNPIDTAPVTIDGKITSADIPALLVLKMLLDRRLIESDLWNDIQLEIRAAEGPTLSIRGREDSRRIVRDWIREIASRPLPEADLEWAREAAVHHLPGIRPQLQSLIWVLNSDGLIPDLHLIPSSQIQDVARIYLQ